MHESFLENTNGHELFTNYFMNLFYTTDLTDKTDETDSAPTPLSLRLFDSSSL